MLALRNAQQDRTFLREIAAREEKHGPLTSSVAEIILEADRRRYTDGVCDSPPKETVFSPEALMAAKAEFAAQEEARAAAIVAKQEEAVRVAAEKEERRAAKEAKEAAKAARRARKAGKAAEEIAEAEALQERLAAAERQRKVEMDAFRTGGMEAYKAAQAAARGDAPDAGGSTESGQGEEGPTREAPPSPAEDGSGAHPPAEAPLGSISDVEMSEEELRTKLRPVFERFDEVNEGAARPRSPA